MPSPTHPLEGVEWRLVEHVGPDRAFVAVPAGIVASAVFADGVVAGSTGCNRWSGPFRVDGAALEIGAVAMTMMASDPERTAVERAFTEALAATAAWYRAGDTLELVDVDGRSALRFRAVAGPPLVGTRWVAMAINNGRSAVTSALEGVEVSATFGEDGRITGHGGCNRFFGPYAAAGSTMSIGPITSTRMACPEPPGVGEQEAAFLAALERVAAWSIREDRLELRDADGALQVDFRPSEAG